MESTISYRERPCFIVEKNSGEKNLTQLSGRFEEEEANYLTRMCLFQLKLFLFFHYFFIHF